MESVLIIVDTKDKDLVLRDEIIKSIKSILNTKFEKIFLYLDENKIDECSGCFNCWIKTPGECIKDDDNNEKNKLIVNSDYVIFISKISYGNYSSSFKVVLDRLIPNIQPFFTLINNEMHHKKRYKIDPKIFTIGYNSNITKQEENTFKAISARNMINFHSKQNEVLVVSSDEELNKNIFMKLNSFCGVD